MLLRSVRRHVAGYVLLTASVCWSFSNAVQDVRSSEDPVWEPPIVSRCKCGAGGPSGGGDAFKEAREVRQLSDEIEKAEVVLNGWKLKLTRAKEYHEKQEKILKHQKIVNDRAPKTESSVTRDEAYYHKRMCELVFTAREMQDKDAEKELMDVCLERKSLALPSVVGGGRKAVSSEDAGCDCSRSSKRSLSLLGKSRLAVAAVASAEDPEKLKEQLKAIKEASKKAMEEYFAKPLEWQTERADEMKELADANQARFDAMESNTDSQKKAFAAVREKVCKLVDGGAPTEAIIEECPA